MAASKPELRSRGKGKTETKDVKTPDAKKKTAEPAGPMDAQGNVMNADYYFKQYVGLVLSMVAFGCVCFAGYAPKYGYTVNLFLYSSTSHPSVPCPFSLLGASHRDALRSPSIPNSKESFRRLPSYTFLTRPPVHSLSLSLQASCSGASAWSSTSLVRSRTRLRSRWTKQRWSSRARRKRRRRFGRETRTGRRRKRREKVFDRVKYIVFDRYFAHFSSLETKTYRSASPIKVSLKSERDAKGHHILRRRRPGRGDVRLRRIPSVWTPSRCESRCIPNGLRSMARGGLSQWPTIGGDRFLGCVGGIDGGGQGVAPCVRQRVTARVPDGYHTPDRGDGRGGGADRRAACVGINPGLTKSASHGHARPTPFLPANIPHREV